MEISCREYRTRGRYSIVMPWPRAISGLDARLSVTVPTQSVPSQSPTTTPNAPTTPKPLSMGTTPFEPR
jgi:hypothetical protein